MPTAISTHALDGRMTSPEPPQVIDVRRPAAFASSERMIAGAVWRDPEDIETWLFGLDQSREVTVYCVHGHHVSQDCAARLEDAGYRVAYLEGGFEQWNKEGRHTARKP